MDNWSKKNSQDVTQKILNFHIDSYEICKNWLKARQGHPLSNEDTKNYQHIVILLKDMVKLVEEIKTAIQYDQLQKLEIFEKVRLIIVEQLGVEPDKVTPLANFTKDLGADSLNTLELVIAIEQAFEVEIPKQFVETIATVQNIIDYISQKVEVVV